MDSCIRRVDSRCGKVLLGVALLGCTALAVAGCGATGSSGLSQTSAPNACKVLTPEIANSIIGPSKLTRKAKPNPSMTQCVYTGKSGGSISILVGDWGPINEFGAPGAGFKSTKVHGIGDEAYVSSSGLVARKGSYGIDVTGFAQSGTFNGAAATNEEAQAAALEEEVAKKVLPSL
jgi:hypothetical protein